MGEKGIRAVSSDAGVVAAERRRPLDDDQVDPGLKLSPGPGLSAQDVAAHQKARVQSALVELVVKNGYQKLRVRDLVKRAGISTRAFYQHYASKEDCFLRTYDVFVRRSALRIISAQSDLGAPDERVRSMASEFTRQLKRSSAVSRFVLVDAYAASSAARERAWRTEWQFMEVLAESLAQPPRGTTVSPLVAEGMVTGAIRVARNRLLTGRLDEMGGIEEDLARWVMSYAGGAARALEALDGDSVWRNTTLEWFSRARRAEGGGAWPPDGDRGLVVASIAKLAVTERREKLTVPRICAAGGVPRATFDACFDSVEACYVAAVEARVAEVLAQMARAQVLARDWAGGIYRAVAALCDCVEGDAFLVEACRGEKFPLGPEGSRACRHQLDTIAEQLTESIPRERRPDPLAAEVIGGAVWGVFHHHMIRDRAKRRPIAATLSYLVLAPLVGGPAAVAAIRAEQSG